MTVASSRDHAYLSLLKRGSVRVTAIIIVLSGVTDVPEEHE